MSRYTRRPEYQEFGKALAVARLARDWSQARLAQQLDMTQTAVASWEGGINAPAPDVIFRLERVLGIAPGALSQHLGYLPLSRDDTAPHAVVDAVLRDPLLTPTHRDAIIALYNTLTQPEPASARLGRRATRVG